jgi:hypothetical protein
LPAFDLLGSSDFGKDVYYPYLKMKLDTISDQKGSAVFNSCLYDKRNSLGEINKGD